MLNLTLITGSADPAALYERYALLSRRYDEADEQLDQIQAQLDQLDEDQADEREHLAAELDRLGHGHSVLLGWVSAFYAAYQFALRGTDSPWIDRSVSSSAHFFASPGGPVAPLLPAPTKRRKSVRS